MLKFAKNFATQTGTANVGAPTFAVPVWVAKFLANFNKQLKVTLPFLGRVRSVTKTSKAKDILGWNPRPAEESILEIANQIKDMGLIK